MKFKLLSRSIFSFHILYTFVLNLKTVGNICMFLVVCFDTETMKIWDCWKEEFVLVSDAKQADIYIQIQTCCMCLEMCAGMCILTSDRWEKWAAPPFCISSDILTICFHFHGEDLWTNKCTAVASCHLCKQRNSRLRSTAQTSCLLQSPLREAQRLWTLASGTLWQAVPGGLVTCDILLSWAI